jgi:1-aminocyclopropane-1-carboxylate deaminase
MFDIRRSVVQKVSFDEFNKQGIELFVKRDDLIDRFVSGNKWRKLSYNISAALHQKNDGILTFGGAFSNHLLATAAACHKYGLRSVGIVRGEELNSESNDVLRQCAGFGMQLVAISRSDYRLRTDRMYCEELLTRFPNMHLVPEGGANYLGMIGCQEILSETANDFDYICVAQGTSTTSAGIAFSLLGHTKLLGVPVLKGYDALGELAALYTRCGIEQEMIAEILSRVHPLPDYHFGGYGCYTTELLDFMERFFDETGLPLDPIYTGKALYALVDWAKKEAIHDCRILVVHTGGIEGGKTIEKKEGRRFS